MVEGGIVTGSRVSSANAASAVESSASVNKTVHVPGLPPLTRREFLNYAWLASVGVILTGGVGSAAWWFFGRGPQTPPVPGAQQPNSTAAPGATLTSPGSNVNASPQPTVAEKETVSGSPNQGGGAEQQNIEATKTSEALKQPQTWRYLANKAGVDVGVFGSFLSDKSYADLLTKQANLLTSAEFNWGISRQPLRPDKNTFDFTLPDVAVNFAQKNDMKVQAHHLIWWNVLPKWLAKNGGFSKATDFSAEELKGIMKNHIQTVVNRYKGKVDEWTVVNEAFFDGRLNNTFWLQNLGSQYIELAFQWAREADSSAKLILNQDGADSTNKNSDILYGTVKDFVSRNIPIDGVGLQMHLKGDAPPPRDGVFQNIKRLTDLGVGVYITEFDVDLTNVPGTQDERWDKQAQIYREMLETYLAAGGKSFAVFGLSDKYSWYNEQNKPSADATAFDRYFNPKPAYAAVQDVLRKKAGLL